MRSFFGLALGGVGCASRAGRVAIGLERKVSPPTPRRKIGRLLNQMWGGVSNPPPSAPNHNIEGHLLGGSLSRVPIVGASLLRGPTLELREHRLHVFCVFLFPCGFAACFLPRLPAAYPPVGRPQAQFSGKHVCFNFDFGKPGPQEAPIAIGGRR